MIAADFPYVLLTKEIGCSARGDNYLTDPSPLSPAVKLHYCRGAFGKYSVPCGLGEIGGNRLVVPLQGHIKPCLSETRGKKKSC